MTTEPRDHQTKAEPYTWTAPDGRKVVLKPFKRLPAGVFRKMRDADEMAQTFALLEAGTDAAGLAIVDSLAIEDVNDLFEKWAEASGASPGEPESSSTSSTSTAPPSTTTGEPGSISA
jgi:hypothetical protein